MHVRREPAFFETTSFCPRIRVLRLPLEDGGEDSRRLGSTSGCRTVPMGIGRIGVWTGYRPFGAERGDEAAALVSGSGAGHGGSEAPPAPRIPRPFGPEARRAWRPGCHP